MKYCGKYCNIEVKQTLTQTPNFYTKKKGTHQNGIICRMCFIKNAIVHNILSVLSYETEMMDHQRARWLHARSVPNHTELWQGHLPRQDLTQPKPLGSFGRGRWCSLPSWPGRAQAGTLLHPEPPCARNSTWVKRTASSQPLLPATLPSSPSSPELLYSLLLPLHSGDSKLPSLAPQVLRFSRQQVLKAPHQLP